MRIPVYQVDAFTEAVFKGNPAAICPLDEWLQGEIMQSIAAENNLSETAFFVRNGSGYKLRWFTPAVEVDLCGHATLASAFVLFNLLGEKQDRIVSETKSGSLTVVRRGDLLALDFPSLPPAPTESCSGLFERARLETDDDSCGARLSRRLRLRGRIAIARPQYGSSQAHR